MKKIFLNNFGQDMGTRTIGQSTHVFPHPTKRIVLSQRIFY